MGKPPKPAKKGWAGEAGINFTRGKPFETTPREKRYNTNPESMSKHSVDALREQIIAAARARVTREERLRDEAYEREQSKREKRAPNILPAPKQSPAQVIRQDLVDAILSGREEIMRLRKKIVKPDNARKEVDMDRLRQQVRKQKEFIQKYNAVSGRLNLPALSAADYRAAYRTRRARLAAEAAAEEAKAAEKRKAAAERKKKSRNRRKKITPNKALFWLENPG